MSEDRVKPDDYLELCLQAKSLRQDLDRCEKLIAGLKTRLEDKRFETLEYIVAAIFCAKKEIEEWEKQRGSSV